MNYGNKIKTLRKSKCLTQSELAKRLYVTDKTISSWENNRTEPNLEMIIKLSDVLECNVSYLISSDKVNNNMSTELKFKISFKEYKYFCDLMQANAEFLHDSYQYDTYYQPSDKGGFRDSKGNKWLRIGKCGNRNFLTYKMWRNDKTCDKYEVQVDDIRILTKIFDSLGFVKIAVVDKTRISYLYLDKYEISLDNVKGLGYFIEIEIKKIDDNLDKEIEKLILTAKSLYLNLENLVIERYPELIMKKI